jgi:hypothetical protein
MFSKKPQTRRAQSVEKVFNFKVFPFVIFVFKKILSSASHLDMLQ